MSEPTTTTTGLEIVVYRRDRPGGAPVFLAQGYEQAGAERWTPDLARAMRFRSGVVAWATAALFDGVAGQAREHERHAMNTAEIRRFAASVTEARSQGGRVSRRTLENLAGYVRSLCTEVDNLREGENYLRLYVNLVTEWNDLIEGLRAEHGCQVSQPSGIAGWRWEQDGQVGEAPTMAAAFLAALRAKGDEPPDMDRDRV